MELKAGPAKVFISCGQASDEERSIAHQVSERLARMGFDPYVAVEVQDLRGLAENIYEQLGASEYFLFIDFRREYVVDERHAFDASNAPKVYRGSLFTNQELAIASYRGLQPVVLQEDGIRRDGILNVIQANCIPFSDRRNLAAVAETAVRDQGWDRAHRNLIRVSRDVSERVAMVDMTQEPERGGRPKAYYHLIVENLHRSRPAANCHAYVLSIRNLSTGTDLQVHTVELKWEGVFFPYVVIGPRSKRSLDLLLTWDDKPGVAFVMALTDSERLMPKLQGPGDWALSVGVLAEGFPEATIDLRLRIDGMGVMWLGNASDAPPISPPAAAGRRATDARVEAQLLASGNYPPLMNTVAPVTRSVDPSQRNRETPGKQTSS